MRPTALIGLFASVGLAKAAANSSSLADLCTISNVQAALQANNSYIAGTVNNLVLDTSSAAANPVYNASSMSSEWFPSATYDYCNVTFTYSHGGRNDSVQLTYWLPAPSDFQNRYLSTGGGGFSISSGEQSLPGGIIYGAVAGTTDGGFGGQQFDSVFLLKNGTADRQALYMFGYEAIHELSVIGKQFTRNIYNMADTSKLYAYYQGCSEGGRDGWSQIQRYGDEWDGAVTGAPAFRFSFQQTNHLFPNVVEQTLGYYPSSCELNKIVNETIAACDPLDGRTDGVVARSDLCKLQFNMSSLIGMSYSCSASSSSGGMGGMGGMTGGAPPSMSKRQGGPPKGIKGPKGLKGPRGLGARAAVAQNGTVTAQGVAVAQTIIDGLKDSSGKQVYFSPQPAAGFSDASTMYNSTTNSYELSINSMGAEWVVRFLQLRDADTFSSLDGVTYDTLKQWMIEGWQKYQDVLETTWPDLTPFQQAGGKVLHIHGEADDSIPAASSVRYHDSVRSVMYSNMTFEDGNTALNEWYKLFLVPGAGHCGPSNSQPNGPWPQTTLETLIDWVENGVEPTTLNSTVLQGSNEGESQQLCGWPLRPLWSNNGTTMDCVYDQPSIDTWLYDLDAVKIPVY